MSLTVIEVEAKQVKLEAEMSTALVAAQALTPATAEFDEAYGRYLKAKAEIAKIPDELSKAKIAENSAVIATAGAQVADAIQQLVTALDVEKLVGTPVIALRYAVDAEGKGLVVFNPITRVASAGSKREAKGTGHTVIVDPEGNRLSLTKFVLANATDDEKASDAFKYPHTQADSKPKFDAFCEAHGLTGFVYELPGKATEAEAS